MPLSKLILASNSSYKRSQLAILQLDFTSMNPNVEENHAQLSDIKRLAENLAAQKANAIAQIHPQHWIVGSDQTAELEDGTLLTKPGSHENALMQLQRSSGQTALFHSAVCLQLGERQKTWSVTTEVRFRTLSPNEIERYLLADKPYDCAGSFKAEALGITLFEHIRSDDPSALIGLPLISLAKELRAIGYPSP